MIKYGKQNIYKLVCAFLLSKIKKKKGKRGDVIAKNSFKGYRKYS